MPAILIDMVFFIGILLNFQCLVINFEVKIYTLRIENWTLYIENFIFFRKDYDNGMNLELFELPNPATLPTLLQIATEMFCQFQ